MTKLMVDTRVLVACKTCLDLELVPYSELIDLEIDLKNNLIDSGQLNAI